MLRRFALVPIMQEWAVAEPDDYTHKLGSCFLQRIASAASLFILDVEDDVGRAISGLQGIWAVVGDISLCPFAHLLVDKT